MTAESDAVSSVEALAAQGVRFARESADGLTLRTRLIAAGLFCAVVAFLAVSFWPAKPVHEDVTPAPQQRQADGSMEASRESTPHPTPAPHIIPKGYKETSRATATVAPSAEAAASGCPPVRLVLSTVVNGSSRRIIASSPDGEVIAAKDEVIEPILMPAPPKPWAAGLGYTTKREVGVWLERRIGERGVVGVEVLKGAGAPRAEIRVGMAF